MSGRERGDKQFFVKITGVENEFEAEVIKDSLEKEEIPVMIRTFRDTAYNGIYILQKGWGNVLVPEEYKEKAKKIVSAIKSSFKEIPGRGNRN